MKKNGIPRSPSGNPRRMKLKPDQSRQQQDALRALYGAKPVKQGKPA